MKTMKKTLAALLLVLVPGLPLVALDQQFLEPTVPTSPVLKAQGGTSTANAEGFDALFANPASFANEKASLTVTNFETTAFVSPSTLSRFLENRSNWSNTNYLDSSNPMVSLMNDLLTKSGLGAEVNWGLGWVGKNLGVGFNLGGKSTAKGKSLLGSEATVDVTLQGVVGMGWPFDVGLGTLRVGGAVRPMQKVYTVAPVTDLVSSLSSVTVHSGFGLGWDLGARWDYGEFKTGLVIRDAGSTVFNFKDYSFTSLTSNLLNPSGGTNAGSTLYRVPTVIALGTTWTPDLGALADMVQPSLSFDLQIPLKDEYTQPSFFTWTHLGGQVTFLKILSVRTGLNQGYFTFGLGAKFAVVNFNLAIYSDELGRYSSLNRRSGIALQWAVVL